MADGAKTVEMAQRWLPAASELILGGQKSGKSRRAELLARDWLAASPGHRAVLIATAQPWDDEMRQRIARHQHDRAQRVPGMVTVEEPLALSAAILQNSRPDTLVVVDCLTLWLTNLLMPLAPLDEVNRPLAPVIAARTAMLLEAIASAPGPVVLVGNEIGLGVIPLGSQVRAFVDALGALNQDVARVCERVTLMAAGLPLTLKAPS
jgi:adenosylcobinamide kinase / adenosylcobinamide-phosphate guanylyltransferase